MDNRPDCAVLVIGGGPCGLMLAIELGRRGISTLVLEEKTSPARFPAANATQARTMEHYRRLGFAEKIRAQGLPPDYPTDIAYFTRLTKYELARFNLPSARAATEIVKTLSGSWSAAELPHRCSQMYIERVLRAEAEAEKTVTILPGWRAAGLRENATGVEVEAETVDGRSRRTFRAAYVLGADGARSLTRKALGVTYIGESAAVRDFMGGRMFAFYFRSPRLYELIPHPRAWMYWTVNRERRAFVPAINGRDEFAFHTQLAPDQRADDISDGEAKAMFQAALGTTLDVEIIARSSWNAGYTLVAEKFRRGRVFIGGDAAHLFTPTGGLGYNTAVEDAVNLGWKLAAVLKGWGGPRLLDSYEPERQAIAKRNTAYARTFADSVGLFVPPPELEDDSPAGEAARKLTGDHFNHHARFEFNIPGITFGGRYDGSPIIVPDGTAGGRVDEAAAQQVVADAIKVLSSALLGLTVGCAQCHDHRYDPVPQVDYYRLRAVFEPAFDPSHWRLPSQRLLSLYTDADRQQAAVVAEAVAALQAEYNAKQARLVAEALEKELEKYPEPQRSELRQALQTPAEQRSEQQRALLAAHPNLNITPGVLYQYNQAAADELKADMARIAAKAAERPVEDFVSLLCEQPGVRPATHVFYRGDHRLRGAEQPGSAGVGAELALARKVHDDDARQDAEDDVAHHHCRHVADARSGMLPVVLAQRRIYQPADDAGEEYDEGVHHALDQRQRHHVAVGDVADLVGEDRLDLGAVIASEPCGEHAVPSAGVRAQRRRDAHLVVWVRGEQQYPLGRRLRACVHVPNVARVAPNRARDVLRAASGRSVSG